jgi:hypothetical protein
VRFVAIRAVNGETAAEAFIDDNLRYDAVRKMAVKSALAKCAFTRAEESYLECLEKDAQSRSKWRDLCEVHEVSGDRAKQLEIAKTLLFCFDTKYYDLVKQVLKESNE